MTVIGPPVERSSALLSMDEKPTYRAECSRWPAGSVDEGNENANRRRRSHLPPNARSPLAKFHLANASAVWFCSPARYASTNHAVSFGISNGISCPHGRNTTRAPGVVGKTRLLIYSALNKGSPSPARIKVGVRILLTSVSIDS